jgi:hypothetical protein
MKKIVPSLMLVACVSPPPESQTPTIKSVSVDPSPVTASADGTYAFQVSFAFSDDVNVETYSLVAPAGTINGSVGTPAHNGTTHADVVLAPGTPAGPYDFTVTITDAMSRMSDPAEGTVVLSPP